MKTEDELKNLIEEASLIAGNQTQLAQILGIPKGNLTQMKQGLRPANWKIRGGLRAIITGDAARAYMQEMASELEQSENEGEKKAAEGFKAILAAFPEAENQKPQVTDHLGFGSWRKRRDSNPR